MTNEQADRLTAATAALLIAGFTALRVAAGRYPFWFDEYATLIFADQPLSRLWSGWIVRETNPPLFYSLVRGWEALGLRSIGQLRLLPELGGAIELALLAAAAWLGWGRRAAIPAIVLAGLSAEHAYASQLLRGYIFAADAVLISLIGLLLVLKGRSTAGLALYVAGAALAVYFHTTMLLWPLAASAALLAVRGRAMLATRALLARQWLAANLAVAALAGWWLWITARQVLADTGNVVWISPISTGEYAGALIRNVLLINVVTSPDPQACLVIGIGALLGSALAWRVPATRMAAAALLAGAVLIQAVSQIHPIVTAITLFWLSLFTVLLIAAGIAAVRSQVAAGALLLALAGVLGTNFAQRGSQMTEQDFRGAIRTAASHPGAALLVEHEAMGVISAKACKVEYPARRCPVPIVTLASSSRTNPWALGLAPMRPLVPTAAARTLARYTAVYTVRTDYYDPLVRFGIVPAAARNSWNEPFREGPLPPARFRAEAYRVPQTR